MRREAASGQNTQPYPRSFSLLGLIWDGMLVPTMWVYPAGNLPEAGGLDHEHPA